MKKVGDYGKSSPKNEQSVEILLPEGLAAYLTPVSILLSAVIVAVVVMVSANKISSGLGSGTALGAREETTDTDTVTADNGTQQQPKVSIDQIKALFDDKTMITFGDKKSKVLLVEISDPSCPYCHIASGTNSKLNTESGDRFKLVSDGGTYVAPVQEMEKLVKDGKASFVYLYQNGHGNGELAVQALYCAYNDNKDDFWKVHNKLMSAEGYEIMNGQGTNTVENISGLLGDVVGSEKMKACLESGRYAEMLTRDQSAASSLGVSGTPGFFVNETNFAGAYSYTDMKSVVEEALK